MGEKRLQIVEERVHNREEVKMLAPKAEYTDEVLQSSSTFTSTQIAKSIGMAAVTLHRWLKEMGVIFYQSGQWMLTARYQGRGLAQMRVAKYIDSQSNEIKTSQYLVWTERGRQFIHQLNTKEG